jgi:NAD(P)H-hydrate epimerase
MRLLDAKEVAPLVPVRAAEAHKGSCGHVLVIAGSRGHTGAALLAAHAACRTGAGLTTLAGPASLNAIFCGGPPEVMTAPLRDVDGVLEFDEAEIRSLLHGKTALIVGPGMGTHLAAEKLIRFLLAEVALPMVIDADALTCLARDLRMLKNARTRSLLTPHPGEMARLLAGETIAVQADRVATARAFAATHDCVLVLKGARSVIATSDGAVSINSTGNPGMASGGMGDALSGILGGLLAQGLTPADAACLGVYLHGEIADHVAVTRGRIGLLASDVIDGIPAGLERLQRAHVV